MCTTVSLTRGSRRRNVTAARKPALPPPTTTTLRMGSLICGSLAVVLRNAARPRRPEAERNNTLPRRPERVPSDAALRRLPRGGDTLCVCEARHRDGRGDHGRRIQPPGRGAAAGRAARPAAGPLPPAPAEGAHRRRDHAVAVPGRARRHDHVRRDAPHRFRPWRARPLRLAIHLLSPRLDGDRARRRQAVRCLRAQAVHAGRHRDLPRRLGAGGPVREHDGPDRLPHDPGARRGLHHGQRLRGRWATSSPPPSAAAGWGPSAAPSPWRA